MGLLSRSLIDGYEASSSSAYSNLREEAHFSHTSSYICLPLIEEGQAQFVAECQF